MSIDEAKFGICMILVGIIGLCALCSLVILAGMKVFGI